MLYDTALLRTFVAICDSGSFTKAAREVESHPVGGQPSRQASGGSGRLAPDRTQRTRRAAHRAGRDSFVLRAAHPCSVQGSRAAPWPRQLRPGPDRRTGIFRSSHAVVVAQAVFRSLPRDPTSDRARHRSISALVAGRPRISSICQRQGRRGDKPGHDGSLAESACSAVLAAPCGPITFAPTG